MYPRYILDVDTRYSEEEGALRRCVLPFPGREGERAACTVGPVPPLRAAGTGPAPRLCSTAATLIIILISTQLRLRFSVHCYRPVRIVLPGILRNMEIIEELLVSFNFKRKNGRENNLICHVSPPFGLCSSMASPPLLSELAATTVPVISAGARIKSRVILIS